MSIGAKRNLLGGWLLLVVLAAALTQWLNTTSESDGADEPKRAVWTRDCPTPTQLPAGKDGSGRVAVSCVMTGP